MPTENPKISAYVPRVVYERFIQFKEKRQVTFSQAAIEIFAEYFDIDLNKSTINTPGGLPDRVSKLEEELENLKGMLNALSEKVNQSVVLSEPLIVDQGVPLSIPLKEQVIESAVSLKNSLDKISEFGGTESELLSNPLITTEDLGAKHSGNQGEEQASEEFESSSIQSNLRGNLLIIDAEALPSKDLGFDLNGDVIYLDTPMLALRLKMSEASLRVKKSKLKGESFYDWLSKRDPDGVRWVYVKKGKKGHYFAPSDLGQDIKDKIIEWIASTKDSNTNQE